MQRTSIEWADYTWNPVEGCEKVSQGCKFCYAEVMHKRFKGDTFTHVKIKREKLREPISKRKGGIVFVNSMSDLFHKDVPFHFIDLVFASMAIANHHTFIILTKRPERALEWFNFRDRSWKHEGMQSNERIRYLTHHRFGKEVPFSDWKWPLENVIVGVSIEDQATTDERVNLLWQIPAWKRVLSVEPLLDAIKLEWLKLAIDWVIVGGESGHNVRPMSPDWVRTIHKECTTARVPFFFKQWGEWAPLNADLRYFPLKDRAKVKLVDGIAMIRQGKSNTGHLLDGNAYREFPKGVQLTFPK